MGKIEVKTGRGRAGTTGKVGRGGKVARGRGGGKEQGRGQGQGQGQGKRGRGRGRAGAFEVLIEDFEQDKNMDIHQSENESSSESD
jgi:hypothetical protein